MKEIKLFIDSAKNYYLVNENPVHCDKCSCELDKIFFMVINWNKIKSNCYIVCNNCLLTVEKTGVIFEAKFGYVTKYVESDFLPVFITTPNLTSSKGSESVFEASFLDSEKTIDKAWRSREYPSLEGASIGKSAEEVDLIESKHLEQSEKLLLEEIRGLK